MCVEVIVVRARTETCVGNAARRRRPAHADGFRTDSWQLRTRRQQGYGYNTADPDGRTTGQWQRTSRRRFVKTDQGRNTGVSGANVLAIVCGERKGWLSLWRSVGRQHAAILAAAPPGLSRGYRRGGNSISRQPQRRCSHTVTGRRKPSTLWMKQHDLARFRHNHRAVSETPLPGTSRAA